MVVFDSALNLEKDGGCLFLRYAMVKFQVEFFENVRRSSADRQLMGRGWERDSSSVASRVNKGDATWNEQKACERDYNVQQIAQKLCSNE